MFYLTFFLKPEQKSTCIHFILQTRASIYGFISMTVMFPKKDRVDFRKSVKYLWILYKENKKANFDKCFCGCFILGLILMMICLRELSVSVCKRALYLFLFFFLPFLSDSEEKSDKNRFVLSLLLIFSINSCFY